MTNGYALNVLSADRPGIVAGVSKTIARLNGNIESCSQTVVSGFFTLIMIVTFPESMEESELKQHLTDTEELLGCQIIVQKVTEAHFWQKPQNTNNFVITAFGQDRHDIVSGFCQYLAGREINIVDLYGDKTDNNEFVLICQVEVNVDDDIQVIQYDLEELGQELGFTVKIQHNNVFVATNQIRLDY